MEAVVARANAVTDLTVLIPPSSSSSSSSSAKGAEDLRGYVEASSLPRGVKRWVFDLTRRNMFNLYEKTWGWSNPEKRRELAHSDARFLVMFAPTTTMTTTTTTETIATVAADAEDDDVDASTAALPVGFVHFRFEVEDAPEVGVVHVAYAYVLQTEPAAQGRGIGRRLMRAVEAIGAELGMERCMLTVRANTAIRI